MIPYSTTKVTLELRDVLASVDENGKPFNLWDFDYPSYYQGEEKKAFEQKIIDHYLFHQIGVETVARFKHNFKSRMREIMPYYIQLYKSVEIMDNVEDPFANVDITETFNQTTLNKYEGESSSTEKGSSTSDESIEKTDGKTGLERRDHRFSNTPQGSLDNLANYLTEASDDAIETTETIQSEGTVETLNTSTITNNGSSESQSDEITTHQLTRKGNQGVNTFAHDIIELRQSFINVDMQIIGALRDLFLMIY